ncbi:MAG: hypothetical protein WCB18_03615 [Thermoplasmata archaeon]
MTATPFPSASSMHTRDYDLFGRLRRRILVSIAATVGWLSLTLLYVAFWAHDFSLFQSIVVIVVSLLILSGVLMGAWISFGMRWVSHWSD